MKNRKTNKKVNAFERNYDSFECDEVDTSLRALTPFQELHNQILKTATMETKNS
jgi:hypothetical protein